MASTRTNQVSSPSLVWLNTLRIGGIEAVKAWLLFLKCVPNQAMLEEETQLSKQSPRKLGNVLRGLTIYNCVFPLHCFPCLVSVQLCFSKNQIRPHTHTYTHTHTHTHTQPDREFDEEELSDAQQIEKYKTFEAAVLSLSLSLSLS